ncbi:MAG: OmpA family protein [Mesorhizobium sp.]|nr:OmpA family protein [Mesorhizobium sp.]MBN9243221.1 OmpA family protein [Mesorhizobium sp.]
MKRQPRILTGSAIALLMASAPLGAMPLNMPANVAADTAGRLPLVRVQADCPEGETCAPTVEEAPEGKHKKRRGEAQQDNAAPAEQAAPAESEQKPRKKHQSEEQNNAAPAQEAAPAEQAAPAEPEPKPRKKHQSWEQNNAAPAQEAAPAEPEPKPRKHEKQKQAEQPAPSEAAPSGTEQPTDQGTESGSKQEKLRNYLKKKQNGEAAPAEKQPEQAKPAEESAPKPEPKPAQGESAQKPAEAAQPPAQSEQPPEQTGEPKSKQEKLRDYLKKKKQGGEATPTEEQQTGRTKPAEEGQQPGEQAKSQAEQPANGQKPAEATQQPAQGEQTEGQAKPAGEPVLPTNTREQAMPKGKAEARPLPKDAAPLPDSAKAAGAAQPAQGQTEGANGKPSGEAPQAGRQQSQQPPAGEATGKAEAVPASDSAAQTDIGRIGRIESVESVEGKRIDRNQWQKQWDKRREEQRSRNDAQVVKEIDNRIIVKEGDTIYVDNRGRNDRLERGARDSYVEELPDDFSRYTIVKDDGTRVVTIRNSYGDIVRRSRIMPDNREVVLYYVPESDYRDLRSGYYDAGADLPPLRLDIPADQYILDAQYAEPDDYYTYLDAPPVEPVERIYSIDEVVHSARIRDKVRRVDLDTITFDTGSAEIGEDQVNHLQALGDAINKILKQNPAETFLIEGHTDAVGSDESNLVLSDERAQSVAEALTTVFNIPAENLTTQGYGERYLKVNTEGANRENRRVAVRRITPLVAPVASAK